MTKLADGVAHTMPKDLEAALLADDIGRNMWLDITPLARNEWICWIEKRRKPRQEKNESA